MRRFLYGLLLAAVLAPASAQDVKKETDRYKEMLAEGSPAELFAITGEELWKKPQGPKQASLEKCDLGKGPGVLKGAYAGLPRYFKDAGRVMDLETRLVYCMTTLQGRSPAEATKRVFGNADSPSEMEYLSAYIASQSHGMPMAPGTAEPQEKAAYELGRELFYHRAGPWDFSCASCHSDDSKRIRLQYLPALARSDDAGRIVSTWPAYLVHNSQFKTLEWRINDCYRQMRVAEPLYGSEAVVSLIDFLTINGQGQPYAGPGIKR